MIALNTQHRLTPAVFWYSSLAPIIASFVAVVGGAFVKDFIASTCAISVCPFFAPYIMPVLVLAFIVAVLAHPVLDFLLFSFQLAEHSITINSGVIFRQYETINFNRIQTLDLERGPLLWLFGLTEVRLWTASADQMNFSLEDKTLSSRPSADTTFVLPRDTAVHLKEFITNAKGPVQA